MSVQFGKITVTAATHRPPTYISMNVQLRGRDKKLSPFRELRDKDSKSDVFRLTLDASRQLKAHRDGTEITVPEDRARPLIQKMIKGTPAALWEGRVKGDLPESSFPRVTLENQNGSRYYENFPAALKAFATHLGLTGQKG